MTVLLVPALIILTLVGAAFGGHIIAEIILEEMNK
jgi:hypothetical protein